MQRFHRRSTKVCTRCRKRKTKCDFKFPECTSCKQAKATCLGFDPSTRQPVPRSLVKSLEAQVAELEKQVLAFQAAPQNTPCLMASSVAQATISVGIPRAGPFLRSKVSPALFFRPSCPPLAVVRERGQKLSDERLYFCSETPTRLNQHERYPSGALINLSSVPFSAIDRMILNYADIHLPQYPCISRSMLEEVVQRTRDEELGGTNSGLVSSVPTSLAIGHFEYFVLFIVLAISAMTLTWKDDSQARAASESFYNSAIKHLQALANYSEIQALQISLLLAHYAHMCPERVDNWTCIANGVRICLNLGLYMESPEELGQEEVLQRSTLFWVAYGMERSLCTNLRLPLSFPEEVITAKFDIPSDEAFNTPGAANVVSMQSAAKHICRYRALETEVHRVLHLEEDLHKFGCNTIESWIKDITYRLEVWYKKAQSYTQYNMLEFKNVQFHHLIVRIHRPTPRLRSRSAEDWRIVLDSSLVLIEDYLGQEQRRRLFYPWHGVHILFETAVISLEACWSCRGLQSLRDKAKRMLHVSIPQCLQLLTGIGQRWNEATVCADRLTPLVQKVIIAFEAISETLPSSEDAIITEEIEGLLFSDGPLEWNRRLLGDTHFDFDDDPLFVTKILSEGLELFQWDPEWDIMPPEST